MAIAGPAGWVAPAGSDCAACWTGTALTGASAGFAETGGVVNCGVVTGSVVIEQIFQVPGLGRYFVQGALNRDYTLVMGVVVFYGGLIVLLNLAVDLIYGLLDPKVEYR